MRAASRKRRQTAEVVDQRYHTYLVLASGSAARARVLRDAGIKFDVDVSGVDEAADDLDVPTAAVTLAERKASAVAKRRTVSLVLGCDSLLELDGDALGKPASSQEAWAMWKRLSGNEAVLHTGHYLVDTGSGGSASDLCSTVIRFGRPTDDELDLYIASGEPLALAGAFSIEGRGAPFIDGIDGDPTNVLGLSMALLRDLLRRLGVAITDLWKSTGSKIGSDVGGVAPR
jgi:septum formation protein